MNRFSLLPLFVYAVLCCGGTNESHASLFGKIKDEAEKVEHKVKHKAKDVEKKAKHKAKHIKDKAKHAAKDLKHHKLRHSVKHGLDSALKGVEQGVEKKVKQDVDKVEKVVDAAGKVAGKATGAASKLISKLPGGKLKVCAATGLQMVQGVEQMVADSTFPKNFCPNFKKFHHAGCSLDGGEILVHLLGKKVKVLQKLESLNDGRCACLGKVFNIYGHAKSQGGFNPETCKDVEQVIHCCEDMMGTIPGLKSVCHTISKVAHKAESPCKKVMGTCPILIANIVAAIAETTENEKEVLNNAAIVCHNIEQLDQKHCCKIAGPLKDKCGVIAKFGDNVCQTLDCPIEMAQFIKELTESGRTHVDCEKLDELKSKDCAAAAKYLPESLGALKNVIMEISQKFHEITEKADKICHKVEDVKEDIETLGLSHASDDDDESDDSDSDQEEDDASEDE